MATVCVSLDHCKSWDKVGRPEFIKLCKGFLHTKDAGDCVPTKGLKRALYELCGHLFKGNLKHDNLVSVLTELSSNESAFSSLLADVFSLLDIEVSCSEDESQRNVLNKLILACTSIVSDAVLKERLDQETLESLHVIPSKQKFQEKYVKTKTRLYYKQQKFNLLREESEGYAKLVSELGQEITSKVTPALILENIKSLIGCFHLDPNRVLDIILEEFECRPGHSDFYVPLLRLYIRDENVLSQVLGFKFQSCQQTAGNETPASLYKVSALLLKHELVTLESLYPHLGPPDAEITEKYKATMNEAVQYARKMKAVITTEKQEGPEAEKDKNYQMIENQKLGLCAALLAIEDWPHSKWIMDRLPQYMATAQPKMARSMCTLVKKVVEPFYKKHSGLPDKLTQKMVETRTQSSLPSTNHVVTCFQELNTIVFTMLRYLGPHLSYDAILFVKIIRLCRSFMQQRDTDAVSADNMDPVFLGILTLLDEVLLPSLSMLQSNCSIAGELWSLLKFFPYVYRYRLYGQWKNDTYRIHPRLVEIKADCLKRSKYILMRLTKESVKPSGRQIGKLSHCNPTVFFEYMMIQIQVFDIIGPVVDALKYLTPLSYDVLAFCIIEALANPEKEKMKHDDTNISRWIQSLANFAGCVCKKYQVDLAGILQYITNQLKAGKSIDLLILREVVQKMSGIEISEEITDDQLEAMAGGELLKQEGGQFAQVRNTKRTSSRLKDTLLEFDMAVPLCLLMAQQRDCIVYQEGDKMPLKLVGKIYDQCHDTLCQYGYFLSTQLSMEEYHKRLPSIDSLMSTYHMPADAAFFLSRPMFMHAINTKFDELKKIDKTNKTTGASQLKVQRYIEAAEHVMTPIIDSIRPLQPPKTWEDLSAPFYVTFWTLGTYDLHVPTKAYEKQIQSFKQQQEAIDNSSNKEMTAHVHGNATKEDTSKLTMGPSKKKKERERCESLANKLADEMKKHNDHVNRVQARLGHEKETWFLTKSTKNETITQFLQLCIFPRCIFTASDAIFCAKMIEVLHVLKTPNFSTLICYDRVFNDITYSVTCCTENEAHRYGRFLCYTLATVMRWHSSRDIFEKECFDYPGFVTTYRKGTDSNSRNEKLDYENYRHVCHKWHFRITKAMVACLESGNFVQIRNALIILTKIISHYPRVLPFGQALERRVNRIVEEEKGKRHDIYALAYLYAGQLKQKKKTWISEGEMHIKDKDPAPAQPKPVTQQEASKPLFEPPKKVEKDVNGKMSEPKDVKPAPAKDVKPPDVKSLKVEPVSKSEAPALKSPTVKVEKKDEDSRSDSKEKEKGRDESRDRSKDKGEHREKQKSSEKGRVKEEKPREDSKERKHKKDRKGEDGEVGAKVEKTAHRRSSEPSPKYADEKEAKRRKVEAPSSAKDGYAASDKEVVQKKSRSPTHDDRDKKLERKRASEDRQEKEERSLKKKKTEEHLNKSLEANGEKSSPSTHKEKHKEKKKESKEKERDRKSEKHSSGSKKTRSEK